MADEGLRPIIVKRVKKGDHAPHGGAWKIAYADFMTAMMAFFLLMWLLGSTSKGDLQGIAQYFQMPLKVALMGGDNSGASSTVLPGGGKDLTQTQGQLQTTGRSSNATSKKAALRALQKQEEERLKQVKSRLEEAITSNPTLKQYQNQLLLDITTEGLRIQIVDDKNRPMFDLSSAELKPYTKVILREIGKVLNDVPNKISIAGHTDATAYMDGEKGYSNWELSSNRANAARRELMSGGMNQDKVVRVIGLGSSTLLDKEDPFNPVNRRISIVVMNKKAEKAAAREDSVSKPASSGEDALDDIDDWESGQ